ncbi:MAG: hypothetical protein IJ458_02240 [Clostridia bacterium]|nr:hypothetical protein [Clostridia bacterium]
MNRLIEIRIKMRQHYITINKELEQIRKDLGNCVRARKRLYNSSAKAHKAVKFQDLRKIENRFLQVESDLFNFTHKYEKEINASAILDRAVSKLIAKIDTERHLCHPAIERIYGNRVY